MEDTLVPSIYDKTQIDESVPVNTEDAIITAKRIVREEGIFIKQISPLHFKIIFCKILQP